MLKKGEYWLRYLLENRLYNFPGSVWCRKCDLVILSGEERCLRCGGKTSPIQFDKVSAIIRRAYQKDKSLLRRVVWDHLYMQPPERRTPEAHPEFPEPFSWLNESVESIRRPKGRPSDVSEIFWRIAIFLWLRDTRKKRTVDAVIEESEYSMEDERDWKRWIAFYKKFRSDPELRLRGEKARRKKRSKRRIRNKRSARRVSRRS